ncbi:DNA-directed DNA polymerase delta [Tulasnella sp. 419]|nr:DNA-directed DNA polymerase delta [Tulasnella sp. 419]
MESLSQKENMPLDHPKPENEGSEPLAKKRKVEGPKLSQTQQPSFADLLEKLQDVKPENETEGWSRPDLKPINPQKDAIIFQQIEIDQAEGRNGDIEIRMFGVTKAGHSVLAHVYGFLPYFFIAMPRGFQDEDMGPFRDYLNGLNDKPGKIVKKIGRELKKSLWGYKGDDSMHFVRISVPEPRTVPKVRDMYSPLVPRITNLADNIFSFRYASSRRGSVTIVNCLVDRWRHMKVTSHSFFGS